MIRFLLKVFGILFLGLIIFSFVYLSQNLKIVSSCSLPKFDNSKNIELRTFYPNIEPFKSKIDGDLKKTREILSFLPLIGKTSINLWARYGSTQVTAIDTLGNTLGSYDPIYGNEVSINMENQSQVEHVLLHEIGGHYLSVGLNLRNLKKYLTNSQIEKLNQAEKKLISSIKRYKTQGDYRKEAGIVEYDISSNVNDWNITWDQLVNAANNYPSDIWSNPSHYREEFKNWSVDIKELERVADEELYAEFTAYLIQVQERGLFDCSYEHPVLKIFKEIKKESS